MRGRGSKGVDGHVQFCIQNLQNIGIPVCRRQILENVSMKKVNLQGDKYL